MVVVAAGGGRGGGAILLPPAGTTRMRPNEEDRPLYVYNPMLYPKILDVSILEDLRIIDTKTTTTTTTTNT
jgi:hypothetical protein